MRHMSMIPIIAIYAAVISTLALIWQVFTWYKNRDNIKIVAEIIEDFDPDRLPASRVECICRIVNSGGQPVSLIEVWAEQATIVDVFGKVSTRRDMGGVGFPMFLGPGQCHLWKFSFPKECGLRCYAKDMKGRVYSHECTTI